jgi:hypothetical protein
MYVCPQQQLPEGGGGYQDRPHSCMYVLTSCHTADSCATHSLMASDWDSLFMRTALQAAVL